jgi:hypothetical protein
LSYEFSELCSFFVAALSCAMTAFVAAERPT